jgi:hypothetical protein
MAKQGLSK